ncbi:YoaK family protein [Kitasatospora mediocidica]|uniref:YoaK family protein n=1 Tax=Kitasatospora mediocidica TaxID=58352 RepID=UPI00056663A3|nr:YoaK family protein [Kitasatospora mediocidica]
MRAVLRGLRRTLLPAEGDRHGPLPPLLLGLTLVTGLVDAVSYLLLGRVFVANMTGNVVFLGFALAGAPGFSLAASATALGAFGFGALLGGRIVRVHRHRGRALLTGALTEAALLAAATLLTATGGVHHDRHAVIVAMGTAMGVQNAVVRGLGVPDLATNVLTTTITGLFADAGDASAAVKAARRLLSVLAMLSGAVAGTTVVLHAGHTAATALPLAGVIVITAATTYHARANAPWTRAV